MRLGLDLVAVSRAITGPPARPIRGVARQTRGAVRCSNHRTRRTSGSSDPGRAESELLCILVQVQPGCERSQYLVFCDEIDYLAASPTTPRMMRALTLDSGSIWRGCQVTTGSGCDASSKFDNSSSARRGVLAVLWRCAPAGNRTGRTDVHGTHPGGGRATPAWRSSPPHSVWQAAADSTRLRLAHA